MELVFFVGSYEFIGPIGWTDEVGSRGWLIQGRPSP